MPLDKVAYKPFLIRAWHCLDNNELDPALEQFRIAAELIREVTNEDLLLSNADRVNSVLRNIKASALTASGWIHLRQGAFSQAAVEFTRATELVPSCKFAARLKSEAQTLEEVSRHGDASLGQLGSSRQMEFESFILKLLGDLYPETANWDPLDMPQSLLLRGLGRAILGDHHGAVSDFTSALQQNCEFGPAYRSRANIYLELGHYERAIEDYTQALTLLGDEAQLYLCRARAHENSGDHRSAMDDCDEAIKLTGTSMEAYLLRGRSRTALGDCEGAIADFSHVLKVMPGERLTLICRAMLYADLGEGVLALADCDRLIKDNEEYDNLYVIRGNVRDLLGDRGGAAADYTRALELNPYHFVAYLERGAALEALGQKDTARDDYRRVLTMVATDAMAHEWRGHAFRLLGEKQKALEEYSQSLGCDEYFVHALLSRGEILAELDDDRNALMDFTTALDIDTCLADAYIKRAWLRLKMKNPFDAIVDCRQLLTKFGWRHRNAVRAAICCYFALVDSGDRVSAKEILSQCLNEIGPHWLSNCARYLLNEITEAQLFEHEFDLDRMTVIHAYALLKNLQDGVADSAQHIEWLTEKRDRTSLDAHVVLMRAQPL
ncbi:MAG TPA: tetratricopeptide repeat protein [Planktothrix sp.]